MGSEFQRAVPPPTEENMTKALIGEMTQFTHINQNDALEMRFSLTFPAL
jgi:hypothetical protein